MSFYRISFLQRHEVQTILDYWFQSIKIKIAVGKLYLIICNPDAWSTTYDNQLLLMSSALICSADVFLYHISTKLYHCTKQEKGYKQQEPDIDFFPRAWWAVGICLWWLQNTLQALYCNLHNVYCTVHSTTHGIQCILLHTLVSTVYNTAH